MLTKVEMNQGGVTHAFDSSTTNFSVPSSHPTRQPGASNLLKLPLLTALPYPSGMPPRSLSISEIRGIGLMLSDSAPHLRKSNTSSAIARASYFLASSTSCLRRRKEIHFEVGFLNVGMQ